MNPLAIYFKKSKNIIEATKVAVLVSGIIFGIVRDIQAPDGDSLFELNQKYMVNSGSNFIKNLISLQKPVRTAVSILDFIR